MEENVRTRDNLSASDDRIPNYGDNGIGDIEDRAQESAICEREDEMVGIVERLMKDILSATENDIASKGFIHSSSLFVSSISVCS